MKTIKLTVLSFLFLGMCNGVYAGDSTFSEPTPNYGSRGKGYGLMALGGVTLALGAFTTTPDQYYNNGSWQVKPFHKQGARSSAIICGVSLTLTGLITAIAKY
tara:strand:- start:3588 stop:3896 length:309 start_codon:yes stop_codon:yes gene_type:complete